MTVFATPGKAQLRLLAGWIESALWLVEHYASEAADRVNQWRTS